MLVIDGKPVLVKCSCMTKTPEPKYHEKSCAVWLANELEQCYDLMERAEENLPMSLEEIAGD